MDRKIKNICVVGARGTGKSSLVVRYVSGHFVDDYDDTFEEQFRKVMQIDGETVLLEMLDTPGYEEYQSMRDHWALVAEGFLIVFSVVDFESYENVQRELECIYRTKERGDVPIVVVGNKIDLGGQLGRAVEKEEAEEYVGLHEGVLYLEASAKSGENSSEIFEVLVMRCLELGTEKSTSNRGKGGRLQEREEVPIPVVHEITRGRTVKPAKR